MEKKHISKTFYYDSVADLKSHIYMYKLLNKKLKPQKDRRRYIKLTEEEKFERRRIRFLDSVRNREMISFYNENPNHTLEIVGTEFGITRERVRQILKRAKEYGLDVVPRIDRSDLRKKADIEKVTKEIKYALKNLYGTSEFFVWAKDFRQKSKPIQNKFLKSVLLKCWRDNILDPLDYVEFRLRPQYKHFEVVRLLGKGYTFEGVAKKINRSKPLVSNLVREARAMGIYPKTSGTRMNQVNAVKLDQRDVKTRLDLIRHLMKQGKNIRQIEKFLLNGSLRHFIARYYHLPKYEKNRLMNNQKVIRQKNEKDNLRQT